MKQQATYDFEDAKLNSRLKELTKALQDMIKMAEPFYSINSPKMLNAKQVLKDTGLTEKPGIELIAEERQRQIKVEGWSAMHDSDHDYDQLATAGAVYALPDRLRHNINRSGDLMPSLWPWERKWWKPVPDNRIRELVKAGALIAAEIDRLSRITGR